MASVGQLKGPNNMDNTFKSVVEMVGIYEIPFLAKRSKNTLFPLRYQLRFESFLVWGYAGGVRKFLVDFYTYRAEKITGYRGLVIDKNYARPSRYIGNG